ncbi:MAG TPA: hypothetical protein VIY90_06365 [Steroidobacteraceae bacterium]
MLNRMAALRAADEPRYQMGPGFLVLRGFRFDRARDTAERRAIAVSRGAALTWIGDMSRELDASTAHFSS